MYIKIGTQNVLFICHYDCNYDYDDGMVSWCLSSFVCNLYFTHTLYIVLYTVPATSMGTGTYAFIFSFEASKQTSAMNKGTKKKSPIWNSIDETENSVVNCTIAPTYICGVEVLLIKMHGKIKRTASAIFFFILFLFFSSSSSSGFMWTQRFV